MKIKSDFVLREVAGTWVVLPLTDEVLNFHGMLSLNQSGVLLWRALECGQSREKLVSMITQEYDVSEKQAKADVDDFIEKLIRIGCVETD